LIFQRRIHATDDELSAYLDGRLDAGVRERVGSHVDGCAICRRALDGLRAVQTSLRGLRAKAPRSFALCEAAARPARARAPGGLSGAMPLLSGVTAMAMLALFAVVGFDMSGGGSSSSAGTKAQPAAVYGLAAPSVADTGSAADAAQSLTVTVTTSFVSRNGAGTPAEATPEPAKRLSNGSGSDTRMHVAEAALAAVALVSGGSAVAVARRRRAA
jgi:anti-sigma factor RsiW